MTAPDLARLVTAFFVRHLAVEHNASPHTTKAYRDALKLLLRFAADACHRPVAALQIDDLTPDLILRFLTDLETTRRNSVRTRNARLAAIHSFFRYVLDGHPECALACHRVLAIPVKKATRPLLGYLTEAELTHVLAQMDRTTIDGERDYVLLALLYDTGARIQELLDLTPGDVRLVPPAVARLHGKGRRERLCPLLPQTARLVSRYLARVARPVDDRTPLFRNRYGQPLKRHGARYLFMKYIDRARSSMASLRRSGISPHTLRHTKAMHLLQAGIPLITIKDFLGHADVKSTEVYVQIDVGMKREALALAGSPTSTTPKAPRLSKDLLTWLEALSELCEERPGEHRAATSRFFRTHHNGGLTIILAWRGGDDDARVRRRGAPELSDEAADARIAGREADVVDEVLPDRRRIAPKPYGRFDALSMGLARTCAGPARRRRVGGHHRRNCGICPEVGGHLRRNCGICPPFAGTTATAHHQPRRSQLAGHGGAIHMHRCGNTARRPSSRPSASTCCCFVCSKTLLIRAKDTKSIALVNVSAVVS